MTVQLLRYTHSKSLKLKLKVLLFSVRCLFPYHINKNIRTQHASISFRNEILCFNISVTAIFKYVKRMQPAEFVTSNNLKKKKKKSFCWHNFIPVFITSL